MKLITEPRILSRTFSTLIERHSTISFAVAWATKGFDGYEQLVANGRKIERGIVGTHFCQTHPDFIKKFQNHDSVRFVKATGGVFHPKLYLFDNGEDEWSCLLGSPNFTKAAFQSNNEACVLFDAGDDILKTNRRKIDEALSKYWRLGSTFDDDELKNYRVAWKRTRDRIKAVSANFGRKSNNDSLFKLALLSMSWKDFYARVLKEGAAVDKRIKLLTEAKRLFQEKRKFSSFTLYERRAVAGFGKSPSIVDWGWFGSMQPARKFKTKVNANSKLLSEALDAIPLTGAVRFSHYEEYIEGFEQAFDSGGGGLATATRLLAMKRPDYFVCFDGKNSSNLLKAFNATLGTKKYERYWDAIIEPMLASEWWNSHRSRTSDREGRVWDGRAAFLDSIYYDRT